MSMTNCKTEPTTKSTAHFLEQVARDNIAAMNNRDFDPSSPGWRHCSSHFSAQTDSSAPATMQLESPKLATFLEMLKDMTKHYPVSKVDIITMTTNVDDNNGTAEVFVDMLDSGNPPGVVREVTCVFEFRYLDARWQAVSYKDLRGINVVG